MQLQTKPFPHLREFSLSYPVFLTKVLEDKHRRDYVILAQIKREGKRFYPFLLLVCHRSFEAALRKKFDFDLLLEIEAKRVA